MAYPTEQQRDLCSRPAPIPVPSYKVDNILQRLHERAGPALGAMAPEALQQEYRRLSAAGGSGASSNQQRPIEGDCPICFETMASGGEKVSSCPECGNHIHAGCLKRWADSKRSTGQPITCPLCRGSLGGEAGSGGSGGEYINLRGGEGPSLDTLYGNRAVWVRNGVQVGRSAEGLQRCCHHEAFAIVLFSCPLLTGASQPGPPKPQKGCKHLEQLGS